MEYFKYKYFNYQIIMEYKIYIKVYKCKLYKIIRQDSKITIYIKNWKYDACVYRKKIVNIYKYYTIFIIKEEKHINYKRLSPKYTINSSFFLNYKLLFTN